MWKIYQMQSLYYVNKNSLWFSIQFNDTCVNEPRQIRQFPNSPIAIFYNYSSSISCIFENSIEDLNFRAIQRCIKQISTKRKNSGGKKDSNNSHSSFKWETSSVFIPSTIKSLQQRFHSRIPYCPQISNLSSAKDFPILRCRAKLKTIFYQTRNAPEGFFASLQSRSRKSTAGRNKRRAKSRKSTIWMQNIVNDLDGARMLRQSEYRRSLFG